MRGGRLGQPSAAGVFRIVMVGSATGWLRTTSPKSAMPPREDVDWRYLRWRFAARRHPICLFTTDFQSTPHTGAHFGGHYAGHDGVRTCLLPRCLQNR